VIEALKPALPREIIIDERNRRILLKVATDDLAIAIGRKGQNARLTSRLIGWRIDIEEFKAEGDDPRATPSPRWSSPWASIPSLPAGSWTWASTLPLRLKGCRRRPRERWLHTRGSAGRDPPRHILSNTKTEE